MSDLIVRRKSRIAFSSLALAAALLLSPCAASAFEPTQVYQPITETMADKTVTLTGRDLTIDQVIDIARNGAKVELSAEALQRSADAYGLLLQGAAEGVTIYWFNRGAGDQRETGDLLGRSDLTREQEAPERAAAPALQERRRAGLWA